MNKMFSRIKIINFYKEYSKILPIFDDIKQLSERERESYKPIKNIVIKNIYAPYRIAPYMFYKETGTLDGICLSLEELNSNLITLISLHTNISRIVYKYYIDCYRGSCMDTRLLGADVPGQKMQSEIKKMKEVLKNTPMADLITSVVEMLYLLDGKLFANYGEDDFYDVNAIESYHLGALDLIDLTESTIALYDEIFND